MKSWHLLKYCVSHNNIELDISSYMSNTVVNGTGFGAGVEMVYGCMKRKERFLKVCGSMWNDFNRYIQVTQ
jgi:hypothetical protein